MFSLLMPSFSLPPRPAVLSLDLLPNAERSPTEQSKDRSRRFGGVLSPVHFRRKTT